MKLLKSIIFVFVVALSFSACSKDNVTPQAVQSAKTTGSTSCYVSIATASYTKNQQFNSTSYVVDTISGNYSIICQMTGQSDNVACRFVFSFPLNTPAGSYALTQNGTYTGSWSYNNSTTLVFPTQSGNITITSVSGNVVSGTYSFQCGQNFTVTSGTFTVTL